MEHMGVPAARASFEMYNTKAEVDTLVDALGLPTTFSPETVCRSHLRRNG